MSGFVWLAPVGLAALGALGLLVLLYILRATPQRRRVSSTLLWRPEARPPVASTPFRRLVSEPALWFELAALAAAATALGQPATRTLRRPAAQVAVVLDASASMLTVEGSARRFDLARRAALARLATLSNDTEVWLFEARARPTLVAHGTPAAVRVALASRPAPSAVEGSLGATLSLAFQRLAPFGGAGRVEVFSDGLEGRTIAPPAEVGFQLFAFGEAHDNHALLRAEAAIEHDPAAGDQLVVVALAANFSSATEGMTVVVEDPEGRTLSRVTARLGPDARQPLRLACPRGALETAAPLRVRVLEGDALGADDVQWLRVPPPRRLDVRLYGRSHESPVVRALLSDPEVRVRALSLASPADEAPLSVFEGQCPPRRPAGDLLVFGPPEGPCLGTVVGPRLVAPAVTAFDGADPRLRFLSLDDLVIDEARPFTHLPGTAQGLLRSDRAALMVGDAGPDGHTTLVGFDPAMSDWPHHHAFVIFVRNVIEEARRHRDLAVARSVAAGAVFEAPRTHNAAVLVGPDGAVQLAAAGATWRTEDTLTPGPYTLREGSRSLHFVSNLRSAQESDLRAPAATPVRRDARPPQPQPQVAAYAGWLLALAALAVSGELLFLRGRDAREAP
ncbi:MAG: BatA domain-containing protein [Myxococcales bacterium]|nr:BatA domain-containing protein [Myxococcales bacterium]